MSQTITFPLPTGANYVIPDVGDENWGQNVTNFLVAIPDGVMPTSGTFTLTGDVSFGPTFGLVSQYFKSATTNPASAGFLRLAKTDTLAWRNNLNNGNLLLAINGSDQLLFNGTPVTVGGVTSITGTVNQIIASASTGAVTLSTPQDIAATSSPTFAALTLTAPLTVPNGGTGVGSLVAFSVLCGGTTSTAPVQSVASVGLSGQFLQSNGAGLMPTWANAAGSGTVNSGTAGQLAYYATSTDAVSGSPILSTTSNQLLLVASTGPSVISCRSSDSTSASLNLTSSGFGSSFIFRNSAAGTLLMRDDINAINFLTYTFSGSGLLTSAVVLAMGSNKITGLANGTATADAAAFGQVQYAFQTAVQGLKTSAFSTNSGTYVATGLTATITPTSSSSRIKIEVNGHSVSNNNANGVVFVTLFRNGSDISPVANNGFAQFITSGGGDVAPCSFSYIDSPASTSALTYEVYIKGSPSLARFNSAPGTATIILEELR